MLPYTRPHLGTVIAITLLDGASFGAEVKRHRDADGEDRWIEREGWSSDYAPTAVKRSLNAFISMALPGLAAQGFPPALNCRAAAIKSPRLLSMPAECPNLTFTADDRFDAGLRRADCGRYSHLAHILQPREVLIGIEDNKRRLFPCCAPYWLTPTIFRYV